MRITELYKPMDVQDAYEKLIGQKKATLMAGGMFLRLQKRTLPLVIDLSALPLKGIETINATEKDQAVSGCERLLIGAMTSLREIEMHPALPAVLRESVAQIAGVAVRNMATIGGSVMGRYPFSDINTALMALNATLHFYINGSVPISTFMSEGLQEQDILIGIEVPTLEDVRGTYKAFKVVYTDFPLVNVAVCQWPRNPEHLTIAIGARPGRAAICTHAYSNANVNVNVNESTDLGETQVEALLAHFTFGDDYRASEAYRRALAKALISDCLLEVEQWKSL